MPKNVGFIQTWLQCRPVLSSFGVFCMSCKVNFHLVRSTLNLLAEFNMSQDIRLFFLEIGVTQLCFVTAIAPKRVNRSPIQWGMQTPGQGGGRAVSKTFFSALRASVWSKNQGAPPPPPGPSPGSATAIRYGFRADEKATRYTVHTAQAKSPYYNPL